MFQDEARVKRINDVRRCWAPRPIRPLCQAMLTHEYTYAYASCEPATGAMDALILPQVNTQCMQIFLDTVAARHANDRIVMVMDGAGWHSSKKLVVPSNIRLLAVRALRPRTQSSVLSPRLGVFFAVGCVGSSCFCTSCTKRRIKPGSR